LIGSSNNPISGMTIATIMATCLVFIGVGWTGKVFEPMALVVGGMICVLLQMQVPHHRSENRLYRWS
jgi:uncharacterized oligopeptide transporter (OPT) family protein